MTVKNKPLDTQLNHAEFALLLIRAIVREHVDGIDDTGVVSAVYLISDSHHGTLLFSFCP